MQNISKLIPNITLIVLMTVTVIICALFYGGSTETVTCSAMDIEAPSFTGAMLYFIYVLIGIATFATFFFAIITFVSKLSTDKKSALIGLAAIGVIAILLLATYFSADTTPLAIAGYEGSQEAWVYQLTNMCMVSAIILATLAIIATISSFIINLFNK